MLMLRWSWRDLRTHWVKVVAIALVIAIGTGGYAGLISTTEWRRISYPASYAELGMYDLRVDLATGGMVATGSLAEVAREFPAAASVTAVEERLIASTQVDASTPAQTVLVRGEIVGSDFSSGGPHVSGYHAISGRLLDEGDSGRPLVMVERNFARFYDLADTGSITLSGGTTIEYVGQATSPEYFTVAPEGEMFMTEASFAALFTTLATAQQLAGAPGMVNNLVLTLAPDADRELVRSELSSALAGLPVGSIVETRDDNFSYKALTTDIEQDQAVFNALAVLLFAGAVGAAFNLIHRLAEQQRREIGIAMALGIGRRRIALRPLLVSAQIALLGVVLGVAVGTLIGSAMGALFEDFVPLPRWETPFQSGVFARMAAIGFVVPFLATAIPVWRAVTVAPIDAIKPAYRIGGWTAGQTRRRPANTFAVLPLRNLRRTPRRTALTVLGIAAAVTVLVGFLGIMDSVFDAVDTAEDESTGEVPGRIAVQFDTFHSIAGPEVTAVGGAASVAAVEPSLIVTGALASPSQEIEAIIELVDLRAGMWRPTVTAGAVAEGPGLLLSEKAAADFGVTVGDTVTLRHPRRQGLTAYTFVDSELTVLGLHPHPVRSLVYLDIEQAGALLDLAGVSNGLNVLPAPGATTGDVQRELLQLPGVASVQPVIAVTEAVREAFEQMLGIIQIMVVVVLGLALLIAFNTAAINLEARARDHATMFAYGVRVRTALRMAITESTIIGVAATGLGVLGGLAMVWWMTQRLLADTLPEFDLDVALRASTVGLVVLLGIAAVALAPLLTARRMRRMDLPGTLRLVE